jgi:hypothetical protein
MPGPPEPIPHAGSGPRSHQPTTTGRYNWQVADWSYLVFPTSTTVMVMGNANAALWFDLVGNAYVPRFNVRQTLLFNPDVIFQRCLADK